MSDTMRAIVVEAGVDGLDGEDEAFREAVHDLRIDLKEAGLHVVPVPPGGKSGGDLASTFEVLVVGGAGLNVLASVLRAWIDRRGRRSLRLRTTDEGGRRRSLEVEGRNVTEEALLDFLRAATDHHDHDGT